MDQLWVSEETRLSFQDKLRGIQRIRLFLSENPNMTPSASRLIDFDVESLKHYRRHGKRKRDDFKYGNLAENYFQKKCFRRAPHFWKMECSPTAIPSGETK